MAERIPGHVRACFENVREDFSMPAEGTWPKGPWGDSARSELRSRLTQRKLGTPEERLAWIEELTGAPYVPPPEASP